MKTTNKEQQTRYDMGINQTQVSRFISPKVGVSSEVANQNHEGSSAVSIFSNQQ